MKTLSLFLLFFSLTASAGPREYGVDRPGYDFYSFNLVNPLPGLCEAACNGQARCRAWTYVRPGVQGPTPRCWLKWRIPRAVRSACCVSGVK